MSAVPDGIWVQLSPAERADLRLVWSRLGAMLDDEALVVYSGHLHFMIRKLRGVYDGLSLPENVEAAEFAEAEEGLGT